MVSLICGIYVGQFLRSLSEGGKMCDYICPSRLGQRIKKTTANETRRKAVWGRRSEREGQGRREHLWGYDSLEGKCCLPTCLQGCQLHHTHTHKCAHAYGWWCTHKKKVLIGKEERMKTVLASVTKAWLIIFWNFICFVMHWNRLLDTACFNCDGGKWIEFDFGHKVCFFEFVFGKPSIQSFEGTGIWSTKGFLCFWRRSIKTHRTS